MQETALRARMPPFNERLDSVSIIVPVRPYAGAPRLASFAARWRSGLEILVSEGRSPAAQRNAAAGAASGRILIFLDDDSDPQPGLIESYRQDLSRDPALAAVGGPAVYTGRTRFGRAVAAALSDPWVAGRSASRYGPHGHYRTCDERELILANLAVRREAFEALGGFDESLYPNEENAFLERLLARGYKLAYDPGALGTRPAPASPRELVRKFYRYGQGRTEQARRGLSGISLERIAAPLLALILAATALLLAPWSLWPAAGLSSLSVAYLLAVALRLLPRHGFLAAALGAFAAVLMAGGYAAGVARGILAPRRSSRRVAIRLRRLVAAAGLVLPAAVLSGADETAGQNGKAGRPEFHLPFPPGVQYRVICGPGDPPHHLDSRNREAYDFEMPPGSLVSAAAEGIVLRAEARFEGPTGRSADNNFVAIKHADGTVSEYHHLLGDGALVRAGERVERGEVIGFSGQSGKAAGPHLHFAVLREEVSQPVRFSRFPEAPRRGESVRSHNVPESLSGRLKELEEALRKARLLAHRNDAEGARAALQATRKVDSELKPDPAARRRALALVQLDREVEKQLKLLEGNPPAKKEEAHEQPRP